MPLPPMMSGLDLNALDPRDLTIGAAALLILIAGSRELWVWGWLYKAAQQETLRERARADRLEDLLFKALGVTQKIVDREKQES